MFDGMFEIEFISLYEHFFAKTMRLHGPRSGFEQKITLAQAKKTDRRLAEALKKNRLIIHEMLAVEDKVVVIWTVEGVVRSSEKFFTISGTSTYRITGGRINEIWQCWDRLGLLEQLGEVRVCSNFIDLEPNYDTLKVLGLEKYAELSSILSSRERECLIHLLHDKTAKEIAADLKLSFRTVQSYMENIKTKLRCQNRRELIKFVTTLRNLGLL